jgi:hypothetical protein
VTGAAGISNAETVLSYLSGSDTYYWTGTAFSSQTTESAAWNAVTPVNTYVSSITWRFLFANQSDWTSQGDQQFKLKARARDSTVVPPSLTGQGNLEDTFGSANTIDFVVDNTAPAGKIVTPASNDKVSNLTQITGTANGDKAGLEIPGNDGVLVRLHYTSGGDVYYWDASAVQFDSTTVRLMQANYSVYTGTITWTLPKSGVPLPTPSQMPEAVYTIDLILKDNAGNTGTAHTLTFTFDKQGPLVASTRPVNGDYYGGTGITGYSAKPITSIAGTAQDQGVVATGIQQVQVRIRDITGSSNYWDGSNFSISDPLDPTAFRPATGSGAGTVNWQYPAGDSLPGWVSGNTYQVNVRGLDVAGNYSTSYATATFLYDIDRPTATLQSPSSASTFVRTLDVISGTARDLAFATDPQNSRIKAVEVQIQRQEDSFYWTGAAWDPSVTWMSSNGGPIQGVTIGLSTASWYLTGSTPTWASGKIYYVRSRVIDQAHNASLISDSTFTFDSSLPTLAITDPADATPTVDTTPRISTTTLFTHHPRSLT